MNSMRKIVLLASILSFLIHCGPKRDEMDQITANKVDVVNNPLEPYKIPGVPSTLHFDEEFTIDTEKEEMVQIGLTDLGHYFDVDIDGNIYLVVPKSKKNIIFKFDRNGIPISSFGRYGKGPGEIISRPFPPLFITTNSNDELMVTNFYGRNLVYFSKEGGFLKAVKLESNLFVVTPLQNGNLLVYGQPKGSFSFGYGTPLIICDENFNVIKELGLRKMPSEFEENRIKGIYYTLSWAISEDMIYVGKQEEGYEIKVYDLDGHLIRKIKKEYIAVPITEEYKMRYLAIYENFKRLLNKFYFPQNFPPYHSFFSDGKGRLYVMTYEEGEQPGEYIYDIFNRDGGFISRKSIGIYHHPDGLFAMIKDNHLYCQREKESGLRKLVVYRMRWE